ncbi:glycosyltransferase family 4 protein [Kouleothrix sp.]|uniref:glycosyltransferase family 4 protein n=1 Tax=Kouleothrix sp. TaxID=2779161 RepID=UPI00391AC28A
MRLAYIAYPTSLTLRSANAIQTHTTLRELRQRAPDTLAIIPRWLREPSRFAEVGAVHLPRPAVGKLSRLYRSTLWYYAERSIFAAMAAALIAGERARGRPAAVVYVREAICAGWWAALWGPLLRLPVIYEAHDLESWNPSRAKERWAQPLLNLLDRAALTRSQAVVSLTAEFRQLLARMGWRAPADVAVIADAFDDAQIAPGDRAAARRQLGIAEDAALVAYSGMTFAYRKLDMLQQAFAQLRARCPNARLALVGGRPAEIAQLRAQAAALGIDDAVIYAGQIVQEQIAPYLHAADVLAIPDTVTDVTASPLKLFEYLAAGRAVALPDIPALAEVLPPTIGYYFRRGDAAALAEALERALNDPARPAREQAGREAVAAHTYAARAERILALAVEVAGKYGTIAA